MIVFWSVLAANDRSQIRDYIAQDNLSAAFEIDALFAAAAARLADFPKLGKIGRVKGTREWVLHPSYVLVYDLPLQPEQHLRILRILHTAQAWPPSPLGIA